MKGVVKTVIAGSVILVIGVVIILISFALNGCSFGFITDMDFETQTYTAKEDNGSLKIDIGAGKLVTEFYEGDKIVIEYPQAKTITTTIDESNGTLTFNSKVRWYVLNAINEVPQTVIKIPKNAVMNLSCEVGAGSASICSGTYANLVLEVNAGNLTAGDIVCDKLTCEVDAGKLDVRKAECNTLECDVAAGKLSIDTAAGPQTKIRVATGSATVGFPSAKSEYSITASVSVGHCNVNSQTGTSEKKIEVNVSAGTASLSFPD